LKQERLQYGLSSYLYNGILYNNGNSNGFYWDFTPTVGTPIPGYDPNKPYNDSSNQAALKNNMRNIW